MVKYKATIDVMKGDSISYTTELDFETETVQQYPRLAPPLVQHIRANLGHPFLDLHVKDVVRVM